MEVKPREGASPPPAWPTGPSSSDRPATPPPTPTPAAAPARRNSARRKVAPKKMEAPAAPAAGPKKKKKAKKKRKRADAAAEPPRRGPDPAKRPETYRKLSRDHRAFLEETFQVLPFPDGPHKEVMAREIGSSYDHVKVSARRRTARSGRPRD